MKKGNTAVDLRPEYEFAKMRGGVRGKYVGRYRAGTNIAGIDPDVAEVSGDDRAISKALRGLIKATRRQAQPAR